MSDDAAGQLWLPQAVRELLLAEAERKAPLETGGLLLGYRTGKDVVVTNATLPGPRAVHEGGRYVPDDEHDTEQVTLLYERRCRGVDYLGDWHTHPVAPPYMSRRDRRTLRLIARCKEARAPDPVMMIVGVDDAEQWSARAWTLTQLWWRRRLRSLKIREFGER